MCAQVGTWQVVIGGLTKAGTAVMDVLVIDNATLRMWKPQLTCACGTPPPRPRFRQTVAVIRCPNHTNTQHHQHMRTSIVDATTSLVPGSNKPGNAWTSQEGALVLFMFGGYTLEVWLHPEVWVFTARRRVALSQASCSAIDLA